MNSKIRIHQNCVLKKFTSLIYAKNTHVSIGISGDRGSMYGNNLALILGVSYFGFWKY
jgi:hypothetical protein